MARLIYSTMMSLDGYVADAAGSFRWAKPDAEVHAFINDLYREVGTHLYGRRMYEVMVAWETIEGDSPFIADFARIWRAADKIVYSKTLGEVSSARTHLERTFDGEAVRRLKAAEERDLAIGGPHLAAEAFRAGLVDEVGVFVAPIVVGGGTAAFPSDGAVRLTLVDEKPFGNGMVHMRYETGPNERSGLIA